MPFVDEEITNLEQVKICKGKKYGMHLLGIENKCDIKRHGCLKEHHMFADWFRVVRERMCWGECKMRLEATEWEPYVTRIASFSKPLKCLCSHQILPFLILKVVIKLFFLKFALVISSSH